MSQKRKGISYEKTVLKTYMDWGNHRDHEHRDPRDEEGYIPIPSNIARNCEIYNAKVDPYIFICNSKDGFLKNAEVKATGSIEGDFAKQFTGSGDMQLFGKWYSHLKAKVGDTIVVTFVEENKIEVELIPEEEI